MSEEVRALAEKLSGGCMRGAVRYRIVKARLQNVEDENESGKPGKEQSARP